MKVHKFKYPGLTSEQVAESRQKNGSNVITPKPDKSFWQRVVDCYHFWLIKVLVCISIILVILYGTYSSELWKAPIAALILLLFTWVVAYLGGKLDETNRKFTIDPLITILISALVLSTAISIYEDLFFCSEGINPFFEPIGIAIAILLATGVGHWLERRNEKTFKSLNEVNDDTPVMVVRNDNVCQVPRRDIVVGDIVVLNTGEEVPADCRILESINLTLNESMFTGEPEVHKGLNLTLDSEQPYPADTLLKGSIILAGSATAVVTNVGDNTENGKVFKSAQVSDGKATPLSKKLNQLATLITKASYLIAVLIVVGRIFAFFVEGKTFNGDEYATLAFVKYLLDTVMIAVTLIVVAVPEGLPMAVTLSLAFSMRRLMRQNTIPRTMHACETMGAASIICTDKTGTLTQNQMLIAETYFPSLLNQQLDTSRQSAVIAECMALNTTANLNLSDPSHAKALGSPTEGAILLWLNQQAVNYLDLRSATPIQERLPFSTENKYMATIVQSPTTQRRTLYVSGAPDILLSLCKTEASLLVDYETHLANYQSQAYRTLALAYAEIDDDQIVFTDGALQSVPQLQMLGIVAISDPLRPDVPQSIRECLAAGIQIKIITGDTIGTAKEIGRQCGLWSEVDNDSNILQGSQMETLTDSQLLHLLPNVKIIYRARPADKERAVHLLKQLGYVVAVTGDGTNDAPALNRADVGLSMGDGTAVAKEASDMTILDNSFATIANAVMWGRSLYKNIKRFILFQMTVNVAACLIVLVGSFIGAESPLTVTQMLWVNLIMDTFAALALASLPPTHDVMHERPRPINEHILSGMGLRILGVGGLFSIILLALLFFFYHNDVHSLSNISLAWNSYNGLSTYELTLFFTFFVMLQFWNMFNAKAFLTNNSAFRGLSWKNTRWFILITLIIFVGQIVIVQLGGEMFNVASGGIAFFDWIIIIATSSLVLWVGELVRLISRKK